MWGALVICETLPDEAAAVAYVLLLGSLLTLLGITGKEDIRWFRGLIRKE